MKTPTLPISLLLLSLLISQAQGIRLDKGFTLSPKQNNNIQEEETGMTKTSSNVADPGESSTTQISSCTDGRECSSSSGGTRKLISVTSSTTTTTTTTTSKVGGEDGNGKAKSSSSDFSKHQEAVNQHYYPDVGDMTEMDYSPARRKPPIHN